MILRMIFKINVARDADPMFETTNLGSIQYSQQEFHYIETTYTEIYRVEVYIITSLIDLCPAERHLSNCCLDNYSRT